MIMRFLDHSWVQLVMRLLLGSVFIYAGEIKISSPHAFADSIAAFNLLPTLLINPLALGLPIFELALGSLLLLGRLRRIAALGSLMLVGLFALALVSAVFRGLSVNCGCFGDSTLTTHQEGVSVGRDLILGGVACAVYLKECVAETKVSSHNMFMWMHL